MFKKFAIQQQPKRMTEHPFVLFIPAISSLTAYNRADLAQNMSRLPT
jgi:hypothetical protein